MIIKVKANKIVNGLELVTRDKKCTCYRVKPTELSKAIKTVYEQTGICKIKVIIEDSKEVLDDESVTKKVKKNQQELLELIVGEKIKILTEEKNVKKFFEAVGFEDAGDIAYKIYVGITKCSEFEIKNEHNIYMCVWKKVFPHCAHRDDSLEYLTLRASIKKWWDTTEYTSLYKILPYNQFMNFLLRNTGYEV